jgi:hypothetical protein
MTKALASQDAETRATLFQIFAEEVATERGLPATVPFADRLPADTGERDTFLGYAAAAAAQANLNAAIAALKSDPKLLQNDEVVASFAPVLAQARGVPAAIAWVQANVPATTQSAGFTPIAIAWTQTDPAAAAQWAHGLSDAGTLNEVINNWGDTDLPAAVHWLKTNTTPEDQATLMPTAFGPWTQKKPADAVKLALTELNPTLARTVLPSLATPIGADPNTDPAAWFAKLPPEQQTNDVRLALALGWVVRDPVPAVQWLQASTAPIDFPALWKQCVKQWCQNDTASLDRWLNLHPPGTLRDAAIQAYALQLAFADANAAKNIAAEMSNPVQRDALDKEIDQTAAAIKAQLAAGGTPGLIFLDENGQPLSAPPKDLSVQIQNSGGNKTAVINPSAPVQPVAPASSP